VGIFHILQNPKIREKLVQELDAAWPDKEHMMGYDALEKLPYLVKIVQYISINNYD
jgi:hypothetical protein